jgi:hypothetical protein
MQQINLYQPIFRKEKKIISAQALFEVAAISLVILFAFHMLDLHRVSQIKASIDAQNLNLSKQQVSLEKLKNTLPLQEDDKLIQQRINRLEKILTQKRKLVAALSDSGVFGSRQGFSNLLKGFARQHIDDVWLENIEIDQGGKYMKLQGKAVSPPSVPTYIRSLSDDPVFKGREFEVFNLARQQGVELSPYISFTLQSEKKAQ